MTAHAEGDRPGDATHVYDNVTCPFCGLLCDDLKITRTGTTYYLHAPNGEIVQLESKSPLYRNHRGGGAPPPKPPRELRPTG